MSLRQRLASRLPHLDSLPAARQDSECVLCRESLRGSDTVEIEDGDAHRTCVRFAQAIGREITRRDSEVTER